MGINTIHLRRGKKGTIALCGFSHAKGEFTNDRNKTTCPQCLREKLDAHADQERLRRAKKK
jgi:hypothetical protein